MLLHAAIANSHLLAAGAMPCTPQLGLASLASSHAAGSDAAIRLWFSHFSMEGISHFKYGARALAHYALANRSEVCTCAPSRSASALRHPAIAILHAIAPTAVQPPALPLPYTPLHVCSTSFPAPPAAGVAPPGVAGPPPPGPRGRGLQATLLL